MRNVIILILAVSVTFISACKKKDEDNREYNKIRITAGSNAGFNYQFSPNKGFWGQATETVRSYRLIFGDVTSPPTAITNYGDIFYYSDGAGTVQFPSPDGQKMQFLLKIDGTDCTLQAIDASLRIDEVSDSRIKGFISGEFQISCTSSTCDIAMDFDLSLEAQ